MRNDQHAEVSSQAYMLEMVQARLAGKAKEERHDLFSNLLAANDEDVEVKLSTPEVIG
jgi:cytochrome P450